MGLGSHGPPATPKGWLYGLGGTVLLTGAEGLYLCSKLDMLCRVCSGDTSGRFMDVDGAEL